MRRALMRTRPASLRSSSLIVPLLACRSMADRSGGLGNEHGKPKIQLWRNFIAIAWFYSD